jgi:hypothetical protein
LVAFVWKAPVRQYDTFSTPSTAQVTPDMMKINSSLMFSGACGDAFRRYASLFCAEVVYMLSHAGQFVQSTAHFRRDTRRSEYCRTIVARQYIRPPWRDDYSLLIGVLRLPTATSVGS